MSPYSVPFAPPSYMPSAPVSPFNQDPYDAAIAEENAVERYTPFNVSSVTSPFAVAGGDMPMTSPYYSPRYSPQFGTSPFNQELYDAAIAEEKAELFRNPEYAALYGPKQTASSFVSPQFAFSPFNQEAYDAAIAEENATLYAPKQVISPFASSNTMPMASPYASPNAMVSPYASPRYSVPRPSPRSTMGSPLSCPTMQSAIVEGQRPLESDPEYNTRPTISSLATSFPIFYSLLRDANLADLFNSPGHFTVFAPTDAAFQNLMRSIPGINLEAIKANRRLLIHILENHVLGTVLTMQQLRCHREWRLKTLSGDTLAITTAPTIRLVWNSDQTMTERSAHVTTPEILASNGIIYPISTVIV
jgi:uncharacterized surface protein with fasciclin (FAS1) repeats